MERRNVLAAIGSGAIALVAAACGGAAKAVKATLPAVERTTTTAKGTATTTSSRPHHHGTTTSSSPTSTTQAPSSTTSSTPEATTQPTTTTIPAPSWPAIAKVADVPVGGTLVFTFGPTSSHNGDPGIFYQPSPGVFVALDTICTHQGGHCAVQGQLLVCPLHGSEFALSTGAVVRSPAEFPLYKANVAARSDGYVWFVTDA